MGRHSRSAGNPPTPPPDSGRHRGRRRRRGAVRPWLLASSAALAVGTVTVSTGLLDRLGAEPGTTAQEGSLAPPELADPTSPEPETSGRAPASPDVTPSPSAPTDTGTKHHRTRPTPKPEPSTTTPSRAPSTPTPAPSTPEPEPSTATATPKPSPTEASRASVAEAAVLELVNAERADAGCAPVRRDSSLAELARDFSQDMAARDFFDHTDPDGRSPWDRAEQAGVDGLSAENIARGQADAEAVMASWMDSPGHRANILNCDYRTLGVGVHFADGGPWWTQDFGW